tara:strand:- start:1113 stop:1295 length:183 start_codon:yes stop_codon:yes gene_type:complete
MTLEEVQTQTTEKLIQFHISQSKYWLGRMGIEPAAQKCLLLSATELVRLYELLKELRDDK